VNFTGVQAKHKLCTLSILGNTSAYPTIWPCWHPKLGHPWGYLSQNRRSFWDMAEPPCKISRRSVKPGMRNP